MTKTDMMDKSLQLILVRIERANDKKRENENKIEELQCEIDELDDEISLLEREYEYIASGEEEMDEMSERCESWREDYALGLL